MYLFVPVFVLFVCRNYQYNNYAIFQYIEIAMEFLTIKICEKITSLQTDRDQIKLVKQVNLNWFRYLNALESKTTSDTNERRKIGNFLY